MELKRGPLEEELVWKEFNLKKGTRKAADESTKKDEVETVKIAFRPLTTDELNSLQDRAIEANVRGKGKVVKGKFKYSDFARRKIKLAVERWEGITVNGKPAPITEENIGILPGWIGEQAIDFIDDMNNLGIEMEGN